LSQHKYSGIHIMAMTKYFLLKNTYIALFIKNHICFYYWIITFMVVHLERHAL